MRVRGRRGSGAGRRQAGADVNSCGGVTRATPLNMAARRGHVEMARALLERGAATAKAICPLRGPSTAAKDLVVQLLVERGASR